MTAAKSVGLPKRRDSKDLLRFGYPTALNWVLLAYAALVVAIGWTYAASRIHADYESTLEGERNRLRDVTTALQAGTLAMLNDGVGAAVAGANEVQSFGGLDRAAGGRLLVTLQKQLTGGDYVRSLFLVDDQRFAIGSRRGASESRTAPSWLTVSVVGSSSDTWVGKPIEDPEQPGKLVIPIARRVVSGEGATGWAGALFRFDGFDNLYRQFRDQILTMGLIGSEGTILVRVPNAGGRVSVGSNVASAEMFRRALSQGNSGIVEGYGPIVKKEVIYSYDLVNGYPFYIVVAQSRDGALMPWHDRRRATIAATAAFSALVLAMTALLNHYVHTLRRREHHYRTLFNNAKFSVFLLEGERFVDANRTAVQMFGLDPASSAVGLAPWDLSPLQQPDGRQSEELAREKIETALLKGGTTFEWLHKRVDTGEPFPAEVDLSSLSTGTTILALAVVHDVTARKRAERDLQALSGELIRLQDEERRRIGRDLHDSTGQTLAALELGLAQMMHQAASSADRRRELLERCTRLAAQCSTEIRTASYLLHPPLLDELGLLSALRWLADGFRQRSSIEVRLDLPESMNRLLPDCELCLFRIAQEALTNVHRHAGSPWAIIRLKPQANGITLEIEDAGRGMPEAPPLGVGLAGMRERIRQIGGTFSVESTGAGTRIRATLSTGERRDTPGSA